MAMQTARWAVALLLVLWLPQDSKAYPTAPGGCPLGVAAVTGHSAQVPKAVTGPLSQKGLVFQLNGKNVTEGGSMDLLVGAANTMSLSGSSPFLGFLIRVNAPSSSIQAGNASGVASACGSIAGLGHVDSSPKMTAEGILTLSSEEAHIEVDVTVVVDFDPSQAKNEYYYSSYTLNAVNSAPLAPMKPSAAPLPLSEAPVASVVPSKTPMASSVPPARPTQPSRPRRTRRPVAAENSRGPVGSKSPSTTAPVPRTRAPQQAILPISTSVEPSIVPVNAKTPVAPILPVKVSNAPASSVIPSEAPVTSPVVPSRPVGPSRPHRTRRPVAGANSPVPIQTQTRAPVESSSPAVPPVPRTRAPQRQSIRPIRRTRRPHASRVPNSGPWTDAPMAPLVNRTRSPQATTPVRRTRRPLAPQARPQGSSSVAPQISRRPIKPPVPIPVPTPIAHPTPSEKPPVDTTGANPPAAINVTLPDGSILTVIITNPNNPPPPSPPPTLSVPPTKPPIRTRRPRVTREPISLLVPAPSTNNISPSSTRPSSSSSPVLPPVKRTAAPVSQPQGRPPVRLPVAPPTPRTRAPQVSDAPVNRPVSKVPPMAPITSAPVVAPTPRSRSPLVHSRPPSPVTTSIPVAAPVTLAPVARPEAADPPTVTYRITLPDGSHVTITLT